MRLGFDGSDLNEAGVEQHVEHKGYYSCWKDDLLPFYQYCCGAMWDFINCDKKNPVDAEKDHNDNKLGAEGIRKAIIHHNA